MIYIVYIYTGLSFYARETRNKLVLQKTEIENAKQAFKTDRNLEIVSVHFSFVFKCLLFLQTLNKNRNANEKLSSV